MTYRRFVIKNAFRNKRRTALTVLSIGFSLFLLILVQTILDALTNPPQTEWSALRMAVLRSTSFTDMMPISYQRRLEQVPHVTLVMPQQYYGGMYREPKNFFMSFATGHEQLFEMYPEMVLSEGAEEAFESEKEGALVGAALMKRFDWEIGDRVTLLGTIFPEDFEFKIVGTYRMETEDNTFYFRFDYLDDTVNLDSAGMFWLMADSAEAVPGIIETVDGMFNNTPYQTRTETEKDFMLSMVSVLGNVQLIMGSVVLVIVFTMLLVAGSTMAMTVRERLPEVAILKAIGYPRGVVLTLILGEAVFIALLGGALGCFCAFALSSMGISELTGGFVGSFQPDPLTIAGALAAGVFIGLVSGLIPALRASSMTVSAAMRSLE